MINGRMEDNKENGINNIVNNQFVLIGVSFADILFG